MSDQQDGGVNQQDELLSVFRKLAKTAEQKAALANYEAKFRAWWETEYLLREGRLQGTLDLEFVARLVALSRAESTAALLLLAVLIPPSRPRS